MPLSSVLVSDGEAVVSSLGDSVAVSSVADCEVVGDCVVLEPPLPLPVLFSASATPAAMAITASTARIHSLPRPLPWLPCPSKPPSSPLP